MLFFVCFLAGVDTDEALWTSAKTGDGIPEVFPSIVSNLPPPSGVCVCVCVCVCVQTLAAWPHVVAAQGTWMLRFGVCCSTRGMMTSVESSA